MPAAPEAVWSVLADPESYGDWVVGSKRIRGADEAFPAPGTRFHHTIGFGPFELDDHTKVLAAHPPQLLRLRAKGRPLGTAEVTLRLTPLDGGTHVEMTENPDGLFSPLALNPVVQLATDRRNVKALRRLEALVLQRASGPGSAAKTK